MDGNTSSFVSSAGRPLQLRMRPDLVVQRQTYQGREYWVVKDPLAQKYFRFEEEEYALLQMLDGRSSIDQIKRRFQRRFSPQKITAGELHQFVGMLYRNSLLVSDGPGQGKELRTRRDENARRRMLGALSNVLAFRFKGIDPDRMLTWLDRRIGWLFSPLIVALSFVLIASAALLVTVEFDTFVARLPAFHDFFAAQNWLWLAATLAITKILHEFGHGLMCKRYGGECHEMGVMLLVLTPCLYCNVSDSWMLPSKWRRMAIGAAGMYVELVLASVCTFLWWFSEPGMLNYLCLNVMFVCSVSTLLFNANPLLRYDGYYILSDLIEIPNLRQKASAILRRKMGKWFLGLDETPDPFLPARRQWLFALYSVASVIYRWVVVLSILWFLNKVFEPYGLQTLGQLIAGAALFGLVVVPLWQLFKFFRVPGRIDKVKSIRLCVSLGIVTALVAGVFFVPLPYYVECSLHVQPRGATAVYVDVPGTVQAIHARPHATVGAGQQLVSLENVDVELEIVRLEGQRLEQLARFASLQQRAFEDESAGRELAQVEEALATIEQQLLRRNRDRQRLDITAPVSGTVIPPPHIPRDDQDETILPTWHGTPLEIKNVGAFFEDGVLVCHVGDPRQLEAILAVDQADIEFVCEGQSVELFLDQFPARAFSSRVEQISRIDMQAAPRALSSKAGGHLATTTNRSGHERPLDTTYEASVSIDDTTGRILVGATGHAKIQAGYQTLGNRLWRYLCRTFRFEL